MWFWCVDRNIWLTAAHLPGSQNTQADHASRIFNDQTEWKLNPTVFQQIIDRLVMPEVDLFASRLNCQIDKYVSWQPDPRGISSGCFLYRLELFQVLCFSSLQHYRQDSSEDRGRRSGRNFVDPKLANPTMVPKVDEITSERTNFASQQQATADATMQQDSHSSSAEQTKPASMSVIRESLQCKGIPQHTLSIIMASWQESTKKAVWNNICKSGKGSVVEGVLILFRHL